MLGSYLSLTMKENIEYVNNVHVAEYLQYLENECGPLPALVKRGEQWHKPFP